MSEHLTSLQDRLQPGTLVIVNDGDAPCARLVAVAERFEGGFWHCRYLSTSTRMERPYGPTPTPVADFGVKVVFGNDHYCAVQTGESVATYPDGEPRRWQPQGSPIQKCRKGPLNVLHRALRRGATV